ncbi:hypothetical protein ACFX58_11450 [Sphingomonas sp. NCPPB 2930]
MGFAAIAQAGIFAPLSSWMSRRAWDRQPAHRSAAAPAAPVPPLRLVPRGQVGTNAGAASVTTAPTGALLASTERPTPLRIVRIVEGRQSAQYAGRMVISGRMADVCAELERLAPQ